MDELTFADTVDVAVDTHALYDLVSDVTRTGEWSPICTSCWWDEGAGPEAGSWFTGHNETADRVWETRSVVDVADPGREFAWLVGGSRVRWAYVLVPFRDDATRLTESWEFLPDGLALFAELYGQRADEQIAERTAAARTGIPRTLAAIKRIAES